MYNASFTKLRSGDWGIRVEGLLVRPGDRVTVRRKDWTRTEEVVSRVVWRDGLVAICEIGRSTAR